MVNLIIIESCIYVHSQLYCRSRLEPRRCYFFNVSKRNSAARSASCEVTPHAKRSHREKYCLHCERHVSKSTYYDTLIKPRKCR